MMSIVMSSMLIEVWAWRLQIFNTFIANWGHWGSNKYSLTLPFISSMLDQARGRVRQRLEKTTQRDSRKCDSRKHARSLQASHCVLKRLKWITKSRSVVWVYVLSWTHGGNRLVTTYLKFRITGQHSGAIISCLSKNPTAGHARRHTGYLVPLNCL